MANPMGAKPNYTDSSLVFQRPYNGLASEAIFCLQFTGPGPRGIALRFGIDWVALWGGGTGFFRVFVQVIFASCSGLGMENRTMRFRSTVGDCSLEQDEFASSD
ncbi:hypothetical protein [Caballeronia sp.]|uniref:hypothetical protein n=1 Tax=Caballeronia sp. TaxID=1931223 RepID=UPI003C4E282C